jgi:hypothetical protein
MKFSEIIGLQDYFQPVFNIENETGDYWKQFIPNNRFYELLNKTLLSVNSTQTKDKLSIWLVGRYGTGKSHASSVIKHLLWDSLDTIEDYIEDRITKVEVREKLKAFRKEKKIIPVVLKGGGNVTDARTLSLEIEKAVKKTLNNLNISIKVKSDFDRIIDKINDSFLNWDVIIEENPDLGMYVNGKDDIIKKLENEDIEFLMIVERILSKKNIHFSHEKISIWLNEISKEIINKRVADGLMIFWDEFTTILEKETISEIINEIQSIAELSIKDNVYLYLITHRDYNQFGRNVQDVLNKVKDRFHTVQYPMVPITTYQILSSALKRKDHNRWLELKNKVFNNINLNELVDYITQNIDGINVKDSVKDLYPIHPYTVYLSTFLANNIGSTQRSIFNFLYDSEHGFIKFLENEISDTALLTADFLWDFYAEELERDKDNRFMQVLEKYNTYKKQIENLNPNYLKVFKGILLLNSLYRITDYANPETDKVRPHINNIKKLFIGTYIENIVDDALEYIDKQEIIQKNPNDLFEISSTSLPRHELDSEKEKLKNQYKNINQIIEFGNIKQKLENLFNDQNDILRKTRVKFFSSEINIHILKNNLNKYFPPSYFIDLAVFLKINDDENDSILSLIKEIKKDDDFKHIVFINVQESLGEDKYKSFIEYLARANVLRNHSFNDDSSKEEEYAAKILDSWVSSINYVDFYTSFNNYKTVKNTSSIGQHINNDIAPRIFHKGIDKLNIKVATVWQFQAAKKAIEYILTANNRDYLESKPKAQYSYIKDIFKDKDSEYIIDKNLKLKDISISHPVIEVYKEVKNIIEKVSEKSSFNLAEKLRFLTQPPYGLYTNILNMAVLGYAFREYVNKLYMANSGQLINTILMRDKVNEIFECWQKDRSCDKLNVRLGTEEENDLIKELSNLFEIEECNGLQDVRWKIKDKVKKIGFPIWSLKFTDIQYEQHINIIDNINKIVFELTDTEIDVSFVKELLSKIQNNLFDLKQIFIKNNFEKGFKNFIKCKGNGKISDTELNIVIDYIKQKQPEELNWKEQDVIIDIKDWIINKEIPQQNCIQELKSIKSNSSDSSHVNLVKDLQPPKPETINIIKGKIEKIDDINLLKKMILLVLEEKPDLANILDKHLRGMR